MKLNPKINLFPHQVEAVNFFLKHNYALCGDEMGLGKSLEGIALSVNAKVTVIVCPAFLKYNWKQEYEKFTKGCKVTVVNGKKDIPACSSSADFTVCEGSVFIINYAKLKMAAPLFKIADLVIADEAHYLKNMDSQRTKLFHKYIFENRPERLLLLTGTPVKNRVEEFFSLLKLLSYTKVKNNGKSITDKFKTSYSFARHFSHERSFRFRKGGREVVVRRFEGLRNESELKTYFRHKYIRRRSSEVLNLPELRSRTVYVKYGHDDSDLQEAFDQFTGKNDGIHISTIKRDSAVAKAPFTAEYAVNIFRESGNPVVIFTDHRDSARGIHAALKKSALINGNTSMENRRDYVNAFQKRELDYLVLTIGAGSTGLTLTASNNMIFNDLSWIPADNAQAKKRIHRIGQENTANIHYIAGSYIDTQIIETLKEKMAVIERAI